MHALNYKLRKLKLFLSSLLHWAECETAAAAVTSSLTMSSQRDCVSYLERWHWLAVTTESHRPRTRWRRCKCRFQRRPVARWSTAGRLTPVSASGRRCPARAPPTGRRPWTTWYSARGRKAVVGSTESVADRWAQSRRTAAQRSRIPNLRTRQSTSWDTGISSLAATILDFWLPVLQRILHVIVYRLNFFPMTTWFYSFPPRSSNYIVALTQSMLRILCILCFHLLPFPLTERVTFSRSPDKDWQLFNISFTGLHLVWGQGSHWRPLLLVL